MENSGITKAKNLQIIDHALERSGLKTSKFNRTKENINAFAEGLVSVIVENLITRNNFGEFKFGHLVTKEGTIFGSQILVTCKKLPDAEEEMSCARPSTCNEDCDESAAYQDTIPVSVFKVADRISRMCLLTKFPDDASVNEFINQIRNDIQLAIRLAITKKVEKDFVDPTKFTSDMTIYVTPDGQGNVTDDQITEAIREAQYILTDINNYNINGVPTIAPANDIYALLNYKARTKYDKLYACCINAKEVFGDWRARVQSTSAINDPTILGFVYDKQTYPIRLGETIQKTIDCGKDECVRIWEQYAGGFIACKSRIKLVIGTKPVDDPQADVDAYIVSLGVASPFTSNKDYDTLSVLIGDQIESVLGINLPTNSKQVIVTLTFKSKDDSAKIVTYIAKVNKTTATEKTTDIVIKASDAALLLADELKNKLAESDYEIKKLKAQLKENEAKLKNQVKENEAKLKNQIKEAGAKLNISLEENK